MGHENRKNISVSIHGPEDRVAVGVEEQERKGEITKLPFLLSTIPNSIYIYIHTQRERERERERKKERKRRKK